MSAIRVVVVDDHALVRAGVKAEIADHVDVVGEADDVEGAIDVIVGTQPDVVLCDVHLPGGNAPAVIAGVRAAEVETTFLALSVSDAAEDVIAVIRAGARGYVTKSIASDDLVDAVVKVAEGDAVHHLSRLADNDTSRRISQLLLCLQHIICELINHGFGSFSGHCGFI